MLTGGTVPELHRSILATGCEHTRRAGRRGLRLGCRLPGQAICSVGVTRKFMELRSALAGKERNGSRGTCCGELSPIGRPCEVDDVIVQRSGPVFREIHAWSVWRRDHAWTRVAERKHVRLGPNRQVPGPKIRPRGSCTRASRSFPRLVTLHVGDRAAVPWSARRTQQYMREHFIRNFRHGGHKCMKRGIRFRRSQQRCSL